ncbi:MAG: DUF2829 domain-containing protein [Bacteroides sp.]|nr:DUF2829 domain-containing protein [Bacteroides sp.]
MKQYIRTQVVKAEPMTYGEAYKNGLIPENSYVKEYDDSLGYLVTHMDGFKDWSPKEVFEQEYKAVEGMTFGLAIKALKAGHKVARKGWNGKGMFLWLKPAATVKSEWCKDPMLKKLADDNGGTIEAAGTICMFTAQHQILTGWLASQTDVLAEDWVIISEAE